MVFSPFLISSVILPKTGKKLFVHPFFMLSQHSFLFHIVSKVFHKITRTESMEYIV